MRIRILLLTTCYPSNEQDPSGIFLDRLAVALTRLGHEVRVLAPSDGSAFGTRWINSIETYRFAYFWPRSATVLTRGMGGIPENLARSRLARLQVLPMMGLFLVHCLLQMRRTDVIYANWLGAGIIGAVANLVAGTPLVVSFRGDDGYLARDKPMWRALTRWVCHRSSLVAPVSEGIRSILADIGVLQAKLQVPRFGVDLALFHPDAHRVSRAHHVRVAFVGSLIPKKGPQDLLEALEDPALKHVYLVMIGDGVIRDELAQRCQRAGLNDRVQWVGLQSQQAVASIIRSCDILCLPSYTEGKPNVIKEAMASGLPVIATSVGGIGELVADRVTGLLYTAGNVHELRECLKALAEDGNLRNTMGQAGLEKITNENADWDTSAKDFDSMFRHVLQDGPTSPSNSSTGARPHT